MATVVYKRNKNFSIWFLRLLLVALASAFIYAGNQHNQNVQYLIAILSLCAMFIPVFTITVYQDKVVITRITLFGLNYSSIDCNNVQLFRKYDSIDGAHHADVDAPAGCLLMLVTALPIYKYQWMELDCGPAYSPKKKANIAVSDKEAKILMDTYRIKIVQLGVNARTAKKRGASKAPDNDREERQSNS